MVGQTANARATNLPAELQSRKRLTALEARLGATLPHLATEANTQAVTVWMLSAAPGSLMAALPAGATLMGGRSRMPTCPSARTSLNSISPHRRSWRRSSGSTLLPTSLRLPCSRAAPQGRSPRGTDAIPVRAPAFFGSLALFPQSRWERPRWRAARLHSARFFSLRATVWPPVHHPRERHVARCGRAAVFSR